MDGQPVVSIPATSASENEDAFVIGADSVVVVDGAGLPQHLRAGCSHTVAWFARSIATTFHRELSDRATPMVKALADTIGHVQQSHGSSCDLASGSPSATVAAWRLVDDHVEYLALCDATIVLVNTDGAATAVTDRRLHQVMEIAARTHAPAPSLPDDPRRWRRAVVEATRNKSGGFWCVQNDPAAATHATQGRIAVRSLAAVLACTDGATRAYELLDTHTIEEFAHQALHGDIRDLATRIRRTETAREAFLQRQGFKTHDDLTIVARPMQARA